MVKHGGFSYSDVNSMPVHERKFFINELIEENSERQKMEKREMSKSKSSGKSSSWRPRK